MTSIAALTVVGDVSQSTPGEVEHLRNLLEKQPCCLLRIALDGQLLAANDAALQELGAHDVAQALGRPFTEWIVAEDHELWHEFVAEVQENGSGDEECDLGGVERPRHPVLLKGVLLTDHPDGIASMLVVARDISGTRRLEAALQDHATTRRALADLRQRLERALAEQRDIRKAIEARDANIGRLMGERSDLYEQVKVLQWRLDGAAAEQVRLGELLEEQACQRKALVATHTAELADAERALAAAAMEKEQALMAVAEHLKRLADQRAELESLSENARSLEGLAAAGRQQIEDLLSATTRAASLSRQFVPAEPAPVQDAHEAASEATDKPRDSGREA